jgi:uncharacterized protein YraI
MRRLFRVRSISLLLAILFVISAVAAPSAARASAIGIVNVQDLYLRQGPSFSAPIKGVLPASTQISLIGRDPAAQWLEANTPIGQGWVNGSFIVTTGDLAALPVTSGNVNPYAAVAVYPAVAVHSGPGLDFPTISILFLGENVDVIGHDTFFVWLEVRAVDGTVGWVLSQYLNIGGNVTLAPNNAASAQPIARPVVYRLRVRSAPNTNSSVIGVLTEQQYAPIIGTDAHYTWWEITGPFGTGWVSAAFVVAVGNIFNVPIVA